MDIISLNPFATDSRGRTYELENNRQTNMILCFRNEGTVSGRHYHTGISKNKDPEILFLLQGTIIFRWRGLQDTEIKEKTVIGPSKIIIPTFIWHELTAISNIIFMEMNSMEDGKQDVAKLEI